MYEIVVYKPESLFPPVIRDLAVLVPGRAHADDVLSLVRKAAGALLKESNVFEAYAGKGVPEGKKNVALTLAFQSFEKNLTASEIDVFMKSIIEKLETQPDWIVRK